MCNRYGYSNPLNRLADEFSENAIPIVRWAEGMGEPNAPYDIKPTNKAPILKPVDADDPAAGLELTSHRWGLVPHYWTGAVKDWHNQKRGPKTFRNPFTNARSDGLLPAPPRKPTSSYAAAFAERRCLVPATHYIEWSGEGTPKPMFRFTVAGAEMFCMAGLWAHAETADGPVDSFTIVTTAAGEDAAVYHDRQPAILRRADWGRWLNLAAPREDLIAMLDTPWPPGSILAERVVNTPG